MKVGMKVYQVIENEDSFNCPFCDNIHDEYNDFKWGEVDITCDRCNREFIACVDESAPYGHKNKMVFCESSYGYYFGSMETIMKNAHGEEITTDWYTNNRKIKYGKNSGLKESVLFKSFK